jgi:hypothetical protein
VYWEFEYRIHLSILSQKLFRAKFELTVTGYFSLVPFNMLSVMKSSSL